MYYPKHPKSENANYKCLLNIDYFASTAYIGGVESFLMSHLRIYPDVSLRFFFSKRSSLKLISIKKSEPISGEIPPHPIAMCELQACATNLKLNTRFRCLCDKTFKLIDFGDFALFHSK